MPKAADADHDTPDHLRPRGSRPASWCSRLVAGNMLSLQLADFGADEIKVEPPGGDPLRDWRDGGHELHWKVYARNKRSRSPWTTNCSTPRSRRWRVNALWPTGGRDDEPDTLALLGSLLWHGARHPDVEDLARQRLSLSQGDAAEHDRRSPWSGRRMLGRGTGRAYPSAHSRLPPSRRGLPQVMGAVALCWCSHQRPSCATGDARERPARAASRWTHRDQAARWDDHHRQGQ